MVPIESGEGIQSKPGHAASNRSELDVLRGDPTDPTEVRHRLDDIAGEPEVDEHGDETVHEPPHPRNRPTVDYVVSFVVECVVEGDDCQVAGPDSLGRIDEESAGQTSETVPNEVGGESHGN